MMALDSLDVQSDAHLDEDVHPTIPCATNQQVERHVSWLGYN